MSSEKSPSLTEYSLTTNHYPLSTINPFSAPVYHEDTVDSTMNVSRILARQGQPHGTVITADFQEAGRGRIRGRSWNTEMGHSLLFTLLLRYPGIEAIPPALTLRTGLAVALAIEDFVPSLTGAVMIKWPNDILISGKKMAGILTEADGGNVHIGIGVNVCQKQFSRLLREKAGSISLAAGREIAGDERYTLLEKILMRLYAEIEHGGDAVANWRRRIDARLYKKGELVCFIEGAADSGKTVNGGLIGIGPEVELLIAPNGGPESEARSFTAGELKFPQMV